jgi:ATP-dependent DNA helicase RecG
MTIQELQQLKESEDKVEFKEAKKNFPFNGGKHYDQNERRKCYLGYVVAFANEGGGRLVFGMKDAAPHEVVGSDFALGKIGALEDEVYEQLKIRVRIKELFENELRVLVTHIPSRPLGTTLKFEGVPLMRVGESLRNMSDSEVFAILSEQEPDFSAKICIGLKMEDLDEGAISKMKESYARKQNNPSFIQLSAEQVLNDLKLIQDGLLNYAALILLGKKSVIQRELPQSKTVWEYRNSNSQIHFDTREVIDEPLFITIDKIWQLINQPTLNRKHPVQAGAYIFDVFDFNETVIREAVLNAIAHRDYAITSEVVIKQFPEQIIINNPGGFPKGVTIENILTVSSTPRSRLMTEILEKTGLVERSGQGVDKIFSITLSEGKEDPDYTSSDLFQVTLILKSEIIDKAFYSFISEYQNGDREPKLGVEQIITLCKIRSGIFKNLKQDIVLQLEKLALIEKTSGHTNRYTLSEEYHKLVKEGLRIGKKYLVKEIESVLMILQGGKFKIGEIEEKMSEFLNRNQIKYLLNKLVSDRIVDTMGTASGMKYMLSDRYNDLRGDVLVNAVTGDLRATYELDSA